MRYVVLRVALFAAICLKTSPLEAAPERVSGPDVSLTAPVPRKDWIPRARWDARARSDLWTRATLSAIRGHGSALIETVPVDIDRWCPAYADSGPERRAAFWVGLISALAKHESTHKPAAVGGGGQWFGLTQIGPATARGYDCRADTAAKLKHGPSNLSCAVRIMAENVAKDSAIALRHGKRAGIARDWGPMNKRAKRTEMQGFTRVQEYCRSLRAIRPVARP